MTKPILIFSAIFAGIILPYGHAYTFLVKYLTMAMLFFAFLDLEVKKESLQKEHAGIAFFNILLPFVLFLILQNFDPTIALVAFIVAIAPTAAGGPIIADLLKSDVAFVTVSVLITSICVALAVPVLLPQLVKVEQPIKVMEVLLPVFIVVFVPLISAQGIKFSVPTLHRQLLNYKGISFYLFLTNVFIACGKASHFVRVDEQTGNLTILIIAMTSGMLCMLNFGLGHFLGKKRQFISAGLALGRKNNMFAIWLSLTFTQPVIALGPIFYIVYQNLYNSWQLWMIEKK